MDLTNEIKNVKFFNWTAFVDAVFQHFKDNASLIGLKENEVVSHRNSATNRGLVIEVELTEQQAQLIDEHTDLSLINEMNFSIVLVLLGQGKSTADATYKELTERTFRLAFIAEHLQYALAGTEFYNSVNFNKQIQSFRAVSDAMKASDNIHNACAISGSFTAYYL